MPDKHQPTRFTAEQRELLLRSILWTRERIAGHLAALPPSAAVIGRFVGQVCGLRGGANFLSLAVRAALEVLARKACCFLTDDGANPALRGVRVLHDDEHRGRTVYQLADGHVTADALERLAMAEGRASDPPTITSLSFPGPSSRRFGTEPPACILTLASNSWFSTASRSCGTSCTCSTGTGSPFWTPTKLSYSTNRRAQLASR